MRIDIDLHTVITNSAAPRMTESILEVKSKLKRSTFVQLLTVKSKEILKYFLLFDLLK